MIILIPVKNNWLKIIASKYKKKRIIGCSGSMSSWANKFSYFRNYKDNYFTYIYINIFILIYLSKFPNPYLRANGLLFHSSDYIKFIKK